jgi:hypothetical protein
MERICFQPQYGVGVATSEVDPSLGRYLIEFVFETAEGHYELWIEYAAGYSRPIRVALDGQVWFDGAKDVTGGWQESAQSWHYEATIKFISGSHRLALIGNGYIPHIRALALLPVSVPADQPAVPPSQRPPMRPERTLVCVLAQTRAHALTWPSFKRNVLDELHADLALAIGVDERYDYANPFWQHAKYRWTTPEYSDFSDAFDEAQLDLVNGTRPVTFDWHDIMKIKDQWLGGIKGPEAHPAAAAILIYFRWVLLHNIMQDNLHKKYDRFVITRSDFMWPIPHPPLSVLTPSDIWFPDGEYYGGLTDRHLVVSGVDLPKVINLIDDIVLRPAYLSSLMSSRTNWNLEGFIRFHLERQDLLRRTSVFPYVMYSVRGEQDKTRWSAGSFNDELGVIVKYNSEYISAKSYANRICSRLDWEALYNAGASEFRRYL